MKITLQDLMDQSGVQFGTSGARGLATAMTDRICYVYTQGFLQYLAASGELAGTGKQVAVAGDLRPSTDRIMQAVCRAAHDAGCAPVNCGKIPSPAVALHGLTHQIPALMVTGSHIPDDRNGIKFNKASGEILKEDEGGIRRQEIEIDETLFDQNGSFACPSEIGAEVEMDARQSYVNRYLEVFPADCLRGTRLGLYQHSAVGRELLAEIFQGLGAEVVPLGFSETFIPVDTEAIRPEDIEWARQWARQHRFDAIISTDGDSDRPLISDEKGEWLRGDIAGILCARYLQADSISTPVSCNTAVEKCGWFPEVRRTRIGSPYVIASMQAAATGGAKRVVGYEANGGFLIQSNLSLVGKTLPALPTRDAVILLLGVLLLARQQNKTVSQLAGDLPARFTASDRLKNFAQERSAAILSQFTTGDESADRSAIEKVWGQECGRVVQVNRTDGIRITFENEEVVHLRPSGNAPEFRCYTEAASTERANHLNQASLDLVRLTAENG